MSDDNFAQALDAVVGLKREGVVTDYAIGGAMAMGFWSEPTPTFDLDVFVMLPSDSPLVSLSGIYGWARRHNYREESEHIVVAGIPIQFIPAHSPLATDAIATAAELDYDGRPVRVIRPEWLIAMSLEGSARTTKRLARVAVLLESGVVDANLLNDVLGRYKLSLPDNN